MELYLDCNLRMLMLKMRDQYLSSADSVEPVARVLLHADLPASLIGLLVDCSLLSSAVQLTSEICCGHL